MMDKRRDNAGLMACGRWAPPYQHLAGAARADGWWEPPTDVYVKDGTVIIRVELAGVQPQGIALLVEGRFLSITGDRPRPDCGDGVCEFRQAEINYGPFRRVFEFPEPLDQAETSAACHDGFLTVLVRPTATGPRRIDIERSA